MKTNTKATFKIYLRSTFKYPYATSLVLFSIVVSTLLEAVNPIYYKKFFDLISDNSDILSVKSALVFILFLILLLKIGSWAFWRVALFGGNYLESKVISDLANYCFAVLHQHSFSFFSNTFVGSLTKKVNRFTRSFESITDRLLWEFIPLVISLAAITYVLFRRNFLLGWTLLGWVIIFLIINYAFVRFKLKYDIKRSEVDSQVTGLLADTITNSSNVKLFTGLKREKEAFFKLNEQLRRLRKFVWDMAVSFWGVQGLLMIGLEIGLFYLAINLKAQNLLTIGDFVLIQTYLVQIFAQISNFNQIIQRFYEDLAEADEMTDIILTTPAILDKPGATELKVSRGEINFNNINFKYGSNKTVFANLNLHIAPHERLALIGPSGAGKTTVIKLLLRMYEATGGKILIDGQNINEVTQESLWSAISLVPQDPVLFHRTIKENIRYGKPESTDEEVYSAAKFSHCDEFIKEMAQGYDTFVGERGIKLSGGERQRVAIARAILRGSPILVLDEATSSLDSESERLIQDAMNTLMQGKTVIVVAHRLSTIIKMDRILVISKGDIAEEGTHEELLQKQEGLYKKLWEMQAGGFIK